MHHSLAAATTLFSLLTCGTSYAQVADDNNKLACIDAATRGQSERDAGHLLEARRDLLSCASDTCPSIIRKRCTEWLGELRQRIPSIVVRVLNEAGRDVVDVQASLDGTQISLDGRPIELDPGQHALSVVRRDAPPIDQVILAVEQQGAHVVTVRLARSGAEAMDAAPRLRAAPVGGLQVPTGAWVLAAVGVIAAGSFAYFGLEARHDLDVLNRRCAPHCDPAVTQSGRIKVVVADVSLGVAAAAWVSAALWTLLPSHTDTLAPVRASISPVHGGVLCTVSTNL